MCVTFQSLVKEKRMGEKKMNSQGIRSLKRKTASFKMLSVS